MAVEMGAAMIMIIVVVLLLLTRIHVVLLLKHSGDDSQFRWTSMCISVVNRCFRLDFVHVIFGLVAARFAW